MLHFLRMLAPRHGDALRSASPVRRIAAAAWPVDDGAPVVVDDRAAAPGALTATTAPLRDEAAADTTAARGSPDVGPPTLRADGANPGAPRGESAPDGPRGVPAPAKRVERDLEPVPRAVPPRDATASPKAPPRRSLDAVRSTAASDEAPRAPFAATPRAERTAAAPAASAPAAPISPFTVSLSAARAAPAAPPTIHVTIDRIEVRAPSTPVPTTRPARPRPSPPSPSLHDYLRGKAPS